MDLHQKRARISPILFIFNLIINDHGNRHIVFSIFTLRHFSYDI